MGAYYISNQDKLMRKIKHIQIRRILRNQGLIGKKTPEKALRFKKIFKVFAHA